ncbi:MAG: DNA mismatch endonuclease Vsr [Spirochaetales bacterium]|nr:DNA mismatch endonuclease Vsr [Spirochaetales bacterium]
MVDEKRSYTMSRIRSKDTSIEKILRSALFVRGIRFRKNVSTIYGHPDIAIQKYKIAIFCDGDFWHGYNWEERKEDIKSNREYWIPKIERNMEKDIEVNHILSHLGYTVIRIWEHEIRKDLDGVCNLIEGEIAKARHRQSLKIRKARITDKDRVYRFYEYVIENMEDAPYSPAWKKGIYPTEEDLFSAILDKNLYILEKDRKIIGGFVLDDKPTEGYEKALWKVENDYLVLHKLAVSPDEHQKGYAKLLTDYAIKEARRLRKRAIRLDVLHPNLPAHKLYRAKGFLHIAEVELYYEDTGLTKFDLYELEI